MVLHNLEQLDNGHGDAIRLLRCALKAEDWQLCQEILRFLHSVDDSGEALRFAIQETGILESGEGSQVTANGSTDS